MPALETEPRRSSGASSAHVTRLPSGSLSGVHRALLRSAEAWIEAGATWVGLEHDGQCHHVAGIEAADGASLHRIELREAKATIVIAGAGTDLADRVDAEAALLDDLVTRNLEGAALAKALMESNDQLLGLSALAHLASGSLDSSSVIASVLAEAAQLLSADALLLRCDDGTHHRVGVATDATLSTFATSVDADVETSVHPAGVLTMLREREGSSTGDRKLLAAVASTVAGRLDLMASHEQAVARALQHQEYEAASRVAAAVLPSEPPHIEGLTIVERCDPAMASGGDFYCHANPHGGLYLAAGDASGKGLPASLLAASAVTTATSTFARHQDGDPVAVVVELSNDLHRYLVETSRLVTLAVLHHRPGSNVVHLANAGHSPVLHRRAGEWELLRPTAPPLGVRQSSPVRTQELRVDDGDLVILGSDGLVDQEDPAGNVIGYDGLLLLLDEQHRTSRLKEIDRFLWRTLREHANGAPQSDDQTVVGLEITR